MPRDEAKQAVRAKVWQGFEVSKNWTRYEQGVNADHYFIAMFKPIKTNKGIAFAHLSLGLSAAQKGNKVFCYSYLDFGKRNPIPQNFMPYWQAKCDAVAIDGIKWEFRDKGKATHMQEGLRGYVLSQNGKTMENWTKWPVVDGQVQPPDHVIAALQKAYVQLADWVDEYQVSNP